MPNAYHNRPIPTEPEENLMGRVMKEILTAVPTRIALVWGIGLFLTGFLTPGTSALSGREDRISLEGLANVPYRTIFKMEGVNSPEAKAFLYTALPLFVGLKTGAQTYLWLTDQPREEPQ